MKPTPVIRRLRDGMHIRCASPDIAQAICLRLNRIGVPIIDGHYQHDTVTYVVELRD